MMADRIDPTDGMSYVYCDTFKDDKCSVCGQTMSRGIGFVKCRGRRQ